MAMLIPPKNFHVTFIARLCFDCTNNIAKYEVYIIWIEVDIDMSIKILEVYAYSTLVIYKLKSGWDTRHPNLIPYQDHALELIP